MFKENLLNKIGKYSLLITVLCLSFFWVGKVEAASLFLRSSAIKIEQGKTFTVKAYVDTQSDNINNVEATLNYPSDLLEALSVNSQPSIFSLWVEEPKFSNGSGTLTFNGGVPNPGYTGAAGQMLSVIFKAKQSGTASIYFSGAAVRANDGMGTDVLSGQSGLDISVSGGAADNEETPKVDKPTAPTPDANTPATDNTDKNNATNTDNKELAALSVFSTTHPNQNAWYSSKDAILEWTTPATAQALQIVFGTGYNTVPNEKNDIATKQKEIKDIDDGVSFFNIRYKSDNVWSRITHYKLQIDSEPPYGLAVTMKDGSDSRAGLLLKANDDTSGIKNYEIAFDGALAVQVPAKANGEAEYLAALTPGRRDVVLTAYDQAGNRADYKTSILVVPNAPPEISSYSSHIKNGAKITAEGITPYSKANLTITLKSASGNISKYDIRSDETGHFNFESEPINNAGTYELWAVIDGDNGATGPVSRTVKILVDEPLPFFKAVASYVFSFDAFVIFIILLLAALAALGWYKYMLLRLQYKILEKRLKQGELESAVRNVKKAIPASPSHFKIGLPLKILPGPTTPVARPSTPRKSTPKKKIS